MHISDGVLSAPTLIIGGLAALAGGGYGLRKLEPEKMMSVAILTAAFFVITLIHLPGDLHLVLNGLLGVMLGWAALPAVAVALLLQSILFQFGGLTSLGVNICIAGYPAVLCGMIFRRFLQGQGQNQSLSQYQGQGECRIQPGNQNQSQDQTQKQSQRQNQAQTQGRWQYLAAFLCGTSAIVLSALTASLFLISSGPLFWGTATALVLAHIPVMLIEGAVTVFIYSRVIGIAPQLFQQP